MNYWLDLFTGTTWDEFRKAGATVSGFRHRMRNTVARVEPGDILLCYMTGVMRWVGALEVLGPSDDTRDIWSFAEFPARLSVKPLVMLDAQCGVPMKDLEGRMGFYKGPEDRGKFQGFVRRSPNLFKDPREGLAIMEMLRKAEQEKVRRPVDQRKLARKPLFKASQKKGKKAVETLVSVPDKDEEEGRATQAVPVETMPEAIQHTEIQYRLLRLGAEMGFDVWAARNDRGKTHDGQVLGELPKVLDHLPAMFNEATDKTVELIDVLWLRGNSIVAAFEVECTTSVYSGLLRMSDLLALQPNISIDLFIVAPEERRTKVEREILRPTFKLREKPLAEVCGFLPVGSLLEKVDAIQKLRLTGSIKADFVTEMADYFGEEGDGP